MSDLEDLRKAVGAAAAVDAYLYKHKNKWPDIRKTAFHVWEELEAELTRREKEARGE